MARRKLENVPDSGLDDYVDYHWDDVEAEAAKAGLWRSPEVLYGDVVDFRPPMPVSADEMRQWAKSTADLLRLGFGVMDEKEARRWSTPPSL